MSEVDVGTEVEVRVNSTGDGPWPSSPADMTCPEVYRRGIILGEASLSGMFRYWRVAMMPIDRPDFTLVQGDLPKPSDCPDIWYVRKYGVGWRPVGGDRAKAPNPSDTLEMIDD